MQPARPFWTPETYEQAIADVQSGKIFESHYLEAKSEIEGGQQGTSKIGKALSAFSTDGGTFAIGLKESQANGTVNEVRPVVLKGLPERISQIAAECDPPVILPQQTILPSAEDASKGLLLVHIPASVAAPHQAPDKRFYGRDDRRSYPLSTPAIERVIRLRRSLNQQAGEDLKNYVSKLHGVLGTKMWMAVVATPNPLPANDQVLLKLMDNRYDRWLHQLAQDGRLSVSIGRPERTSSGVALRASIDLWNSPSNSIHELEIDRNGTIRYATNEITAQRNEFGWRMVIDTVTGVVQLANKMWDQLGASYGISVAVYIYRIQGIQPQSPYSDSVLARHAADQSGFYPIPYQANFYERSAQLDAMAVRGDLADLHNHLFSPLLNSMGLPQFTDLPDSGQ